MKQIPNYPNYSITTSGKVWSHKSNKWLTPILATTGYFVVSLGKANLIGVHRLVALTYISNPENKFCTNHLNGIKTDNRVENLEWATLKENNTHRNLVLGTYQKGEQQKNSVLTDKLVMEIRATPYYYGFYKQKAEQLGVDPSLISRVYQRKAWRHIP